MDGSRIAGPCAKKHVVCTIATPFGKEFVGTNECRNPQAVCPREPGEGYEKCRSVCQQDGHAEIVALRLAGEEARGAVAYISHHRVCHECQDALRDAGVLECRTLETK